MPHHKVNSFFYIGIKGKLSLLFLLSSIIPFALIGYYGYHSASQALMSNILSTDKHDVTNIIGKLQDFLKTPPNDLHFLTNLYALERFLQWRDIKEPYKMRQWSQDVRNTFYSFILYKKIYAQLQIINLEGTEVLRIDYDPLYEKATLATHDKLQAVHDQDYFSHALTLPKHEIYLTGLDFDEKTASLETYPIIRYATAIVDKNNITQGVLVLSLFADNFLNFLKEENKKGIEKNFHYLLISHTGTYLNRPERSREWGWQLRQGGSLKQDAPELFRLSIASPQGTSLVENTVSTFEQFLPWVKAPYRWVLIKQTNKKTALAQLNNFIYMFAFMIVGILMFILLTAFWIRRWLINPLLLVNNHLKALAQGMVLEDDIAYRSEDEVGELIMSTWRLKNSNKNTINQVNAIAAGNYTNEVKLLSGQDQLGRALVHMTQTLREVIAKNAMQDWLKTAQTQLNAQMSGEQDVNTLAQNIIHFLTTCLQAQVGLFYLVVETEQHPHPYLKLIASYAYARRKHLTNEFQFGEGLVGQAALEKQRILITEVPDDYIYVQSGLGETPPHNIIVVPLFYENLLKGVIEIGSFHELTTVQIEFLEQVAPDVGIAVNSAQSRAQMHELLQQTQTQAEELRSQAEELQNQQEILSQTNVELEERTQDLERQKNEIREKNLALEKNQVELETKARELQSASQYKSEFLANMSHELRTPLNSLLILAQLLMDNKEGNLNDKQIKYARTIHSAGSDLLALINDILDLSKVEAGKMEIHATEVSLRELADLIEQKFRHVAEEKELAFHITLAQNLPPAIYTDAHRLKQIINNLLSNALKFTSQGEVKLAIYRAQPQALSILGEDAMHMIAMSVSDSGVGIPKEKQKDIFEAFQQADGTTSRRYGGTGLGLSISRQLARLLGGDIILQSEEDKGSVFILYLPEVSPAKPVIEQSSDDLKGVIFPQATCVIPTENSGKNQENIVDDRQQLQPGDKFILVIEDDPKFSDLLMELAQEKGFKCLIAEDGHTGLQLTKQYRPHAIILDISLPEIDGWGVMEKLKADPETRHIPVHFISVSDQSSDARKMGAIGYLLKPVNMEQLGKAFKKIEQFLTNTVKSLLVVVEDTQRQQEILDLIGSDEIDATLAVTRTVAYQHLSEKTFDCIVLDVDIEQGSGLELLKQLYQEDQLSQIPIIIYADRELTPAEEHLLQYYTDTLTVKAVCSPERLLDEATLFLHQIEADLPQEKRQMLRMVHNKATVLANKKVMIVDDDTRNTFALATILEDQDMEVVVAKNGKEALTVLDKTPNIAIVLMDVMMPEMDGYEAMRKIRAQTRFQKLPIIALTAKAMKGDKAKCIEAGANDYLAKPVDTDKLVSLMKVWLYR